MNTFRISSHCTSISNCIGMWWRTKKKTPTSKLNSIYNWRWDALRVRAKSRRWQHVHNTIFYLVKMLIANISFLVCIRSSMNSIIQILPTHFLVLISIYFETPKWKSTKIKIKDHVLIKKYRQTQTSQRASELARTHTHTNTHRRLCWAVRASSASAS